MIKLEEELTLGIKIMALLHSGMMDIPAEMEIDDIDLRLFVPTDMQEQYDYQLTSHPLEYVAPVIYDFLDEYYYLEKYPATAKPYNNVNSKFWAATTLYSSLMNQFKMVQMKAQTSKDGQGLDAVKEHFNIKR